MQDDFTSWVESIDHPHIIAGADFTGEIDVSYYDVSFPNLAAFDENYRWVVAGYEATIEYLQQEFGP